MRGQVWVRFDSIVSPKQLVTHLTQVWHIRSSRPPSHHSLSQSPPYSPHRSHQLMLRMLEGHDQNFRCLDVCEDKVVIGSYDCTCRIWDVHTGACLHVLRGHFHQSYCVPAFDGARVASEAVRVWHAESGYASHRWTSSCAKTNDCLVFGLQDLSSPSTRSHRPCPPTPTFSHSADNRWIGWPNHHLQCQLILFSRTTSCGT